MGNTLGLLPPTTGSRVDYLLLDVQDWQLPAWFRDALAAGVATARRDLTARGHAEILDELTGGNKSLLMEWLVTAYAATSTDKFLRDPGKPIIGCCLDFFAIRDLAFGAVWVSVEYDWVGVQWLAPFGRAVHGHDVLAVVAMQQYLAGPCSQDVFLGATEERGISLVWEVARTHDEE